MASGRKLPSSLEKIRNIAPDAEFIDALGRAWLVYYARKTVVMVDGAKRTFFTPDHGLDLGNPIVGSAFGTQVWVSGTGRAGFLRWKTLPEYPGIGWFVIRGTRAAFFPTEHDGLWLKAPEGVIRSLRMK